MSKYIEELTMHVADSQVLKYAVGYEKEAEVVNKDSIEAALDMLDSLGENARQLLEIGIIMDKLIDMGFERTHMILQKGNVVIGFFRYHIEIEGEKVADELHYTSSTWQEDVLTKVKGILNE